MIRSISDWEIKFFHVVFCVFFSSVRSCPSESSTFLVSRIMRTTASSSSASTSPTSVCSTTSTSTSSSSNRWDGSFYILLSEGSQLLETCFLRAVSFFLCRLTHLILITPHTETMEEFFIALCNGVSGGADSHMTQLNPAEDVCSLKWADYLQRAFFLKSRDL